MIRLTRRSMEECIMAAFASYIADRAGTVVCRTTDNGDVEVQCVIHGTRFNCGVAGYLLDPAEVENLRHWCISHPGAGWSFGFRGTNHDHPHTVNVTLIDRTPLMFNFHVNIG